MQYILFYCHVIQDRVDRVLIGLFSQQSTQHSKLANSTCCHVRAYTCVLSHVQLFATPCTVACQAPLSMGFPGKEYLRGLPSPSPGYLSDPGIEPTSPALQADSTYWHTAP